MSFIMLLINTSYLFRIQQTQGNYKWSGDTLWLLTLVLPKYFWHIVAQYDTRCCFNVWSEADTSQLNVPHGAKNYKWKKEKLKSKNWICSEVLVNSPGNLWSQSWRRKGRLRWEGFAEKGVLSLKRKSERVMNDENSESMEPVGEVGVSTCVSRREPGGFCLSKVLLPHSLADSN